MQVVAFSGGKDSTAVALFLHERGTLHIYFRRVDLVALANRIVADHYGVTLADGRRGENLSSDQKMAP